MHDKGSRAAQATRRTRRGFTLIELLIVVAIVVLLAAVAIPLISQSRDDLARTELDAIARQIFVAAQNKSTAMAALGTFDDFDAAFTGQKAQLPDELNKSGDYHYAGHTYLSDEYLDILPAGSIEHGVLSDQYFIEYNSKTGDIYGVFYGKEGFSYAEAASLRTATRRKTESGVSIGYFGGAVGTGLESLRTKAPAFTLVNDEELYVRFANIEAGVVYTLTVTDATAAGVEPLYFRIEKKALLGSFIASDPTLSGAVVKLPFTLDVDGDLYIVLDSLDGSDDPNGSNRRFKHNFTDKDDNALITPGHDLYISGKAQKALDKDKKILYLESDEVSFFANSLFDSVLREKGKNESVSIHCFRHLQNLDAASGYAPAAPFEAKLTAALDWNATAARKATPGYTAPGTLTAISNAALLVFDGQGNAIANAPLGANKNWAASDHTAGLFGIFSGQEGSVLRRVRLENAALALTKDTAVTHAGMLAGLVTGDKATVMDCRVYATAENSAANPGCLMDLPLSVQYAGGLIGYMQGGAASDCFAAVPALTLLGEQPIEARYAGGLIGFAHNVSLERCYANTGALTLSMGGAADRLGGLLGLADGGACAACYAAGTLDVGGAAAGCQVSGFANVSGNASFTSCYTAVTYGEGLYAPEYINPDDTGVRKNAGAKVFAFADAAKGQSADGRYYLRTDGVTEFCTDAGQTYGEGLSYDAMATDFITTKLLDARWTSADAAHSHPYSLAGAYPFPIPTNAAGKDSTTPYPIDHYGDWPARQGEKYLIYYEKYKGGAYGYFAKDIVETISDSDTPAVVEDGYAVLCESADPAPTLTYFTAEGVKNAALPFSGQRFLFKGVSHSVYLLPDEVMNESIAQKQSAVIPPAVTLKDSYFHAFSAGGYRFFANPNFAKYIINGADMLPGASIEPAAIAVRTSRQLHRLSLGAQNAYWDRVFSQERDIDFDEYPARVSNQPYPQPIGNGDVPFTGIFDGNEHVINSLNVTLDQDTPDPAYAGMFGLCTTTARLTRIRLQNASVNASGVSTSCAGILAGKLATQTAREGSDDYIASNCYVYAKSRTVNGVTIDGKCTLITDAGVAGGLAGTIEDSSLCDSLASPTLIEMGNGSLGGGFAGEMSGTRTNIERCYANTGLFKAGSVGMVGGFAGMSTATVRGAYALGRLSVKDADAAGFILQNNGACYDCYTLCTYNLDDHEGLYQTNGYGFSKSATATQLHDCYYWGTSGVREDSTFGQRLTYDELLALRNDAFLLNRQYFTGFTGTSNPYTIGGNYPFAFLIASNNNIMPHHGDWPSAAGTYLAYYERYADNTYGYYTAAFDLLDNATNRAAQKVIVEDGYAILATTPPSHVTYGRKSDIEDGDADNDYNILKLNPDTEEDTFTTGGVTFHVYRFKENKPIMGMGSSVELAEKMKIDTASDSTANTNMRFSFYYRVSIDGAVYYFNPCFAKTVVTALTMEPARDVSIRTARQLRCLADGRTDYKYWGWHALNAQDIGSLRFNPQTFGFVQEHDIDGSVHGNSTLSPIGSDQRYFRNAYNGGCFTISGFSVKGHSQHTGLFGYNAGRLANIVFLGDGTYSVTSSGDRLGGLVGTNGKGREGGDTLIGSISNCVTAGFDLRASGTIGGFVGVNEGTISQCAAVHYGRGNAGGGIHRGQSGGFVCTNSGTIDHCYAITANTFHNKESQSGFVKENTGSISNAYCASYYDASGTQGYLPFGVNDSGCFAYNSTTHEGIMAAFEAFKVDAAHSYPFDAGLAGTPSPWPSFVFDHSGNAPVFYGDWITP